MSVLVSEHHHNTNTVLGHLLLGLLETRRNLCVSLEPRAQNCSAFVNATGGIFWGPAVSENAANYAAGNRLEVAEGLILMLDPKQQNTSTGVSIQHSEKGWK